MENGNELDYESDESQQSDEETSQQRQKIKERLSKMSFEDLQKLKEEMGTKSYNRTVLRTSLKKKATTTFKRANKNRPREMSSKKAIKVNFDNSSDSKKSTPRDPRFESVCGTFDKKIFKENYKFIIEMRKKEKQQLENNLKKTTDPEEKKQLKFLIQRLSNQIREDEVKEKHDKSRAAEINDIKRKLEKGEKPHFKKKSVKKLESLINKFEDLKKTNKLQKHIERRSKKLSIRERQKLERQKLM